MQSCCQQLQSGRAPHNVAAGAVRQCENPRTLSGFAPSALRRSGAIMTHASVQYCKSRRYMHARVAEPNLAMSHAQVDFHTAL